MSDQTTKILAITGMPGVGKSSVVDILVREYNLPRIYFGNITLEEVKRRGLEQNQENERKVRQELREKYGMAAYAQLSLPKIQEYIDKENNLIIDGLYSWSEYTLLRQSITTPILLLVVIARRNNRYKRLAIRPQRPLTHEEAEKRDFAEIEHLEKGGPIALCDYYLANDGNCEELSQKVHSLAKELQLTSAKES